MSVSRSGYLELRERNFGIWENMSFDDIGTVSVEFNAGQITLFSTSPANG